MLSRDRDMDTRGAQHPDSCMLSHEEGIEADMVKLLSAIPIFRRLFISFAIAATIPAIVIVILGNFYIASLTARSQAVQTSFDAQSLASQQETNLQAMNALLKTSLNNIFAGQSGSVHDPSLVASGGLIFSDLTARETNFEEALATYQSNYELATSANMSNVRTILLNDNPTSGIIGDQHQALSAVLTTLWPQYKQVQDIVTKQLNPLENDLLQGKTLSLAQINQTYEQIYPTYYLANSRFTELQNNWQRVTDDAVSMGKTVTAVGPSVTQPVLIATVVAIVASILIVFTTGWLVNLTITQPLRRLASLTRRISKGDTSARARVIGRDEIYLVATSMNNMLDNIVRLIQDAQAQRDSLQAQVEKLVSEVSGVGEGDLRVQAEVTADALGVLADSFNYMVEELGSLVVRVKMVAQEVENSTTMTFERMSQLVEAADAQIKQIAEAAIEVERMADSSRQVAERAQILYGVAREARKTAESGREAVQQTVEGMGRIHEYVQDTSSKVQTLGDRSREINNIVEVIANIAHQTNRLALDAAIQAAMAGENGKGFGAVAADIRRLAERAKDQASSIARIVRSVREDIGAVAVSMRDTERETSAGAKLAEEAGSSLESIFGVVERQAYEIESINQVAAQQLQSSSAVVQIMQAVTGSTEQSSASTREAAQNMERLARLAEQLLASVEAFKLRENLNYYAPMGNVMVTPEEEYDNQLTVSGVFRTITATAQPVGREDYNRLAPAGANRVSYPPAAPYLAGRQGNGNNWPAAPNPQWPQQQRYGGPQQQQIPPPFRRPGNDQHTGRENRQ